MIMSIDGLAWAMGCSNADQVAKALYKSTECGICFSHNELGVAVSGYAEGTDAECPNHILEYPFSMGDFMALVDLADKEGCDLWHEANSQDDEFKGWSF